MMAIKLVPGGPKAPGTLLPFTACSMDRRMCAAALELCTWLRYGVVSSKAKTAVTMRVCWERVLSDSLPQATFWRGIPSAYSMMKGSVALVAGAKPLAEMTKPVYKGPVAAVSWVGKPVGSVSPAGVGGTGSVPFG